MKFINFSTFSLIMTVSIVLILPTKSYAKEWYLQCNACHPLQQEDPNTLDAVEQFIFLQSAVQPDDVIDVYRNEYPPSGTTLTLEHWYGVLTIPANRSILMTDISSYGTMADVLDNAPPSSGPGGYQMVQFQVGCSSSTPCFFPVNPIFSVTGWLAGATN